MVAMDDEPKYCIIKTKMCGPKILYEENLCPPPGTSWCVFVQAAGTMRLRLHLSFKGDIFFWVIALRKSLRGANHEKQKNFVTTND